MQLVLQYENFAKQALPAAHYTTCIKRHVDALCYLIAKLQKVSRLSCGMCQLYTNLN